MASRSPLPTRLIEVESVAGVRPPGEYTAITSGIWSGVRCAIFAYSYPSYVNFMQLKGLHPKDIRFKYIGSMRDLDGLDANNWVFVFLKGWDQINHSYGFMEALNRVDELIERRTLTLSDMLEPWKSDLDW